MVRREIRKGEISGKHVARIISDFLDGKRSNIEHITFKSGISGIKEIYAIPSDTRAGRTAVAPNVMRAYLVTPSGKYFGEVAIKHYKTSVREEDAATLLPPTIAQSSTQDIEKKLAVQRWMAKPTANEYIMEAAKIINAWGHLVPKRRSDVVISDLTPQNIRKWAVDLDIYSKNTAKEWDKVALREFYDEYGRRALLAISKAAKLAGLAREERTELLNAMVSGKIDDRSVTIMRKMLQMLPKTPEFWTHHIQKDLKILRSVEKLAPIPERRRREIQRLARYLERNGHKNMPTSLLNLLELERNIMGEWISAYKREIERATTQAAPSQHCQ